MRHISEASPVEPVEHTENKPKAGEWYAEVERALEHNSPDRLLAVVSGVVDKQGETLTEDERQFLLRVMKHAKSGVEEREGRWAELRRRLG